MCYAATGAISFLFTFIVIPIFYFQIVGISLMVATWSAAGMDTSWSSFLVAILVLLMLCTVTALFGVACTDPGLLIRHADKPNGCESW